MPSTTTHPPRRSSASAKEAAVLDERTRPNGSVSTRIAPEVLGRREDQETPAAPRLGPTGQRYGWRPFAAGHGGQAQVAGAEVAATQVRARVGRISAQARVAATTATARISVATSWLMAWSRSPSASVGTTVPV